jgi:hypothetical protein
MIKRAHHDAFIPFAKLQLRRCRRPIVFYLRSHANWQKNPYREECSHARQGISLNRNIFTHRPTPSIVVFSELSRLLIRASTIGLILRVPISQCRMVRVSHGNASAS